MGLTAASLFYLLYNVFSLKLQIFFSLFLPLLNFYLHLISLSFTLRHFLPFTLVLYLLIYPHPSSFLIFNPCPLIFLFHLLIYHFLPLFHFSSSSFSLLYSFILPTPVTLFFCPLFIFSRADDSGPVTHKDSLPVRSLVLGDIQRMGSEVAYMVGPLRCHGDSTSICMHIVSMHLICAVKNLQKKNRFKLNLQVMRLCGFTAVCH